MDEFEWNVVHEGQLLDAMHGHKPVGINKYFQMAFICDKFTDNINKDINPQKIWAHLETMYNLEALDESESIPFPNSEKDFALPESDFGQLMTKKEEDKKSAPAPTQNAPVVAATTVTKGRETPKNDKSKDTNKNHVTAEECATNKEKEKEKPAAKNSKEAQRRDSKDSKDSSKSNSSVKKETLKKEPEKPKGKGRNSVANNKDDKGNKNNRNDDAPKVTKRPTRNSKPDDSGSSGKSSPINVTPSNTKRRRL